MPISRGPNTFVTRGLPACTHVSCAGTLTYTDTRVHHTTLSHGFHNPSQVGSLTEVCISNLDTGSRGPPRPRTLPCSCPLNVPPPRHSYISQTPIADGLTLPAPLHRSPGGAPDGRPPWSGAQAVGPGPGLEFWPLQLEPGDLRVVMRNNHWRVSSY